MEELLMMADDGKARAIEIVVIGTAGPGRVIFNPELKDVVVIDDINEKMTNVPFGGVSIPIRNYRDVVEPQNAEKVYLTGKQKRNLRRKKK
jgi:hypothetical protein